MRRSTMFKPAVAVAATLALTACTSSTGPGGEASDNPSAAGEAGTSPVVLPADAAAVVGETEVPLTLVEDLAASVSAEQPDVPELDIQRDIASSLIQFAVAMELGMDNDIEVTEEEVQVGYDSIPEVETERERLGLEEQVFKDWLVAPNEIIRKLQDKAASDVSDEELQTAFEEQSGGGELATVFHILVDTKKQANDALKRINDGEEFEAVAAEVSTDGSAANGGALGEMQPLSGYVEPFAKAASEAEIGEVVGPVETQFGFHLIRVDERGEPKLADMEDDLRAQLAQPAVGEMIEAGYNDLGIKVASQLGVWDAATRTVVAPDAVGDTSASPAPGASAPAAPVPTEPAPTEG